MKRPSKTPGFFKEKEVLTRRELREKLREAPSVVPGTGKRYTRRERVRMEQDFFDRRKYGSHVSRQEFERVVRKLQGQRFRAKTEEARRKLGRAIRYLKEVGGV